MQHPIGLIHLSVKIARCRSLSDFLLQFGAGRCISLLWMKAEFSEDEEAEGNTQSMVTVGSTRNVQHMFSKSSPISWLLVQRITKSSKLLFKSAATTASPGRQPTRPGP